jgi:hypothetical protein
MACVNRNAKAPAEAPPGLCCPRRMRSTKESARRQRSTESGPNAMRLPAGTAVRQLALRKCPVRQARSYGPSARRPILDKLLIHRQPRHRNPHSYCVRYRREDCCSGQIRDHRKGCLLLLPRGVGRNGEAFRAGRWQHDAVRKYRTSRRLIQVSRPH